MKALVKQICSLAGSFVLLYAAILTACLVLMPRQTQSMRLNSEVAPRTVFATEPKYVFLNRSPTASTAPKIILVGASNVMVGFRQAQLQKYMPNVEVHNLAVGGSNMTQVGQVVDLVQELQSPEAMRNTTYVIGMWYGQFAEDGVRWNTSDRHAGDTDIDIERYRYGFFRRSKNGPEHVLPPQYLDLGVTLIYPYLALDNFVRDQTRWIKGLISPEEQMLTEEERNASVVTDVQKVKMLKYWDAQMQKPSGELSNEQFERLSAVIEKILRSGGRVMLVDLPIPKWHAERSPYEKSYLEHKQRVVDRFTGRQRFAYLDKLGDDDLDFSDEVHPKPRVAQLWAANLAKALKADAILDLPAADTSLALVPVASRHE